MASKSETAQLLRSLGFSYLEIARELYPQDYQRYLETRDRRLYERLKTRVKRLVKYSGSTPSDDSHVPPGPGARRLWRRAQQSKRKGGIHPLYTPAPPQVDSKTPLTYIQHLSKNISMYKEYRGE